MNEDEREQVLTFIEQHFPELAEELGMLREAHPEAFQERMRRITPAVREMMEVTHANPQRAELMIEERRFEMETRRLVEAYLSTDDAALRSELREQLLEVRGDAFNVHHELQALKIQDVEKRLEELRLRHERRAERRDELIEQQVNELLELRERNRRRGGR